MEDSHIVDLDLGDGLSFIGVYDGHGGISHNSTNLSLGNEVADFVKHHLV